MVDKTESLDQLREEFGLYSVGEEIEAQRAYVAIKWQSKYSNPHVIFLIYINKCCCSYKTLLPRNRN